ncbi:MAG TPA: hypothetical protein VHN74_02290 [Candidatus Angelobacter sp.]|jgi:hypothetical protein|nr:hypothetical protein [Candidatus Angelobacter sp.]
MKDFTVGTVPFNFDPGHGAFSQKVLDTLGKDIFSGGQNLAVVGSPGERAG